MEKNNTSFKDIGTCPICSKKNREGLSKKELKHIERHSMNLVGVPKEKVYVAYDGRTFKTQKELDEYLVANPQKVSAISEDWASVPAGETPVDITINEPACEYPAEGTGVVEDSPDEISKFFTEGDGTDSDVEC